jgi:hypothetical protein
MGSRCSFSGLSVLRKANISYVISVRIYVRVEKLCSCQKDFGKKLYFGTLLKIFSKKSKFYFKTGEKKSDTLH